MAEIRWTDEAVRLLHDIHDYTVSSAGILIIVLCVTAALPDATVVQSGSPTFPLQVDNMTLTVMHGLDKKKQDSTTIRLPVSLYAELRDNIDTIFTYADALRRHRRELSGNTVDEPVRPCLTIDYMGLCVMRIFFLNGSFKSGKLVAAVDRYPFVVVLTKGFSVRLKKLIKPCPRWSPADRGRRPQEIPSAP